MEKRYLLSILTNLTKSEVSVIAFDVFSEIDNQNRIKY